jgi:hypothetical protein
MSRRRARRKHGYRVSEYPEFPVDIRVGSRKSEDEYLYLRVTSEDDAGRFQRMLADVVATNPRDPLLIVSSGYQPFLESVFQSCLDELWSEREDVIREAVCFDSLRFPEHTSHRMHRKLPLPWAFVLDQLNLPDVYSWTFNDRSPPHIHGANPDVDMYRLRVGAWTCTRGAYVPDRSLPVTMIFLKQDEVSDHIARNLIFPTMFDDEFYGIERTEDENVAYIFLRLFGLISDWENIVREFEGHLAASEANSRDQYLPVKLRTRTMHHQVGRHKNC